MRPGRGLCEAEKTVRRTEPRRFLDWQRRWPNNGEVTEMDDIKLALLGNKEAAKRLTDAGVLVPCPGCRGKARVRSERYYQPNVRRNVICTKCFTNSGWYKTEYEARLAWNTRTPILSAEEIEMIDNG